MAASTIALAEPALVTSSWAAMPRPFSEARISRVAAQSLMSAATTQAPAAARLRANSWPRPRAAPVIATTLPSMLMGLCPWNEKPAVAGWRQRVLGYNERPTSEHEIGTRIDQVHLVHVGDKRHGLAGVPCRRRIDAAADFDAVDQEIDHRLHAHRLDDIELDVEGNVARREIAALLDHMLGSQPENQLLAGVWPIPGDPRFRDRQAE